LLAFFVFCFFLCVVVGAPCVHNFFLGFVGFVVFWFWLFFGLSVGCDKVLRFGFLFFFMCRREKSLVDDINVGTESAAGFLVLAVSGFAGWL
jgi:hypothetical protein